MIGILVVLYNKPASESETLKTLRHTESHRVLVLDNSTGEYESESYCRERGFDYFRFGENRGLSRAYNFGIDRLKGEVEAICIFDDDTAVPPEYLEAAEQVIASHPQNHIFLPLVYDTAGLLSPSRFQGNDSLRAESAEEIPPAEITGINTGCLITIDLFDRLRYDESLFLDFVDHRFLADAKRRGAKIKILPIRLRQDFSDQGRQSLRAAAARFAIYAKDCRSFYREDSGYARKRIFLRCGKLTVKYRSLRFLPILFKNL